MATTMTEKRLLRPGLPAGATSDRPRDSQPMRVGLAAAMITGVLLFGHTALCDDVTIWQVGRFDGTHREFSGPLGYHETFAYDVDADPDDEINAPDAPEFLDDQYSADLSITRNMEFHFVLDSAVPVSLTYDRWGSETDEVLLDGLNVAILPGPGEGAYARHEVPLGYVESGAHVLTIRYVGGGIDDGHFVDAYRLTTDFSIGDLNCDGEVNGFDIDPFILALSYESLYYDQYPDCDIMLADCNGDGYVDGFDIDPFVELLGGG